MGNREYRWCWFHCRHGLIRAGLHWPLYRHIDRRAASSFFYLSTARSRSCVGCVLKLTDFRRVRRTKFTRTLSNCPKAKKAPSETVLPTFQERNVGKQNRRAEGGFYPNPRLYSNKQNINNGRIKSAKLCSKTRSASSRERTRAEQVNCKLGHGNLKTVVHHTI